MAPWFILPFLTAFTICWLARQPHWRTTFGLHFSESTTATFERAIDGLVLGLLMLPGYAIAVGLVEQIEGKLPPIFSSRFDLPIMAILAIVGFFVGCPGGARRALGGACPGHRAGRRQASGAGAAPRLRAPRTGRRRCSRPSSCSAAGIAGVSGGARSASPSPAAGAAGCRA